MKKPSKHHKESKIDSKLDSTYPTHQPLDKLSLALRALVYLAIATTIGLFALLVGYILYSGIPHLSSQLFEWHYNTQNVSMLPSIINTLSMVLLSLLIATPIAIFGAIYLQEYARSDSYLVFIIGMAAETLAGIPSIVYGLFGFLAFVIYAGMGYSMLAGALTLSIMVLPFILRNTQEALKCVPLTYKEAGLALGARQLAVLFRIILPCAISGILSGVILSVGRIVGESAALLYTSGSVAQIASVAESGRTLSVHIYQLLLEGLYIKQAAASAVVLLLFVVGVNMLSHFIAKRLSPPPLV